MPAAELRSEVECAGQEGRILRVAQHAAGTRLEKPWDKPPCPLLQFIF